jgi:hypothetical protein
MVANRFSAPVDVLKCRIGLQVQMPLDSIKQTSSINYHAVFLYSTRNFVEGRHRPSAPADQPEQLSSLQTANLLFEDEMSIWGGTHVCRHQCEQSEHPYSDSHGN